jgi:phosphate transport system substrate-binding protein
MHKLQDKPVNGAEVLKFFDWSYSNGALMAKALDYVPMPDNVVKLIETSWKTNMKSKDGAAVWTK